MTTKTDKIDFANLITLDTFLIENDSVKWLDLHIQRTLKALQILKANSSGSQTSSPLSSLQTPADLQSQLNSFYQNLIDQNKGRTIIARVEFKADDLQTSTVTYREYQPLMTLKIALLPQAQQPAGEDDLNNYKWSQRPYWDDILRLKPVAADDILCINTEGYFSELSRFNVFFFDQEKDEVITPSLKSGCIEGVFRQAQLQRKLITLPDSISKYIKSSEKKLVIQDLKFSDWEKEKERYQILAGNSVRGLVACHLISTV